MEQLTFIERIKSLFQIIASSPFFIAFAVILVLTLIVLIINARSKNKVVKNITIFGYLIITIYLLVRYGSSILKLSDNLVEKVFTVLYFPNLLSYICMMVIATLLIIFTVVSKKISKFARYSNIFIFIVIEFLFVLTLDVIVSKNIDIYSKVAVYSNKTLIVLIQSSMGIFGLWVLVLIIDLIANGLLKKSKSNKKVVVKEEQKINVDCEKIGVVDDDDFNVSLTNKGFQDSFVSKNKKQKYEKYRSYVTHGKK